MKRQRYFDAVSSSTRNVGYDNSFFATYRVDKTGFSSIRRTCNNDQNAILQKLRPRPCKPIAELSRQALALFGEQNIERRVIIVIVNRLLCACGQDQDASAPVFNDSA